MYKVKPLLDKVIRTTLSLYKPGNTIVVDETMVPFRGRLCFKQYNPPKPSAYAIKIYKICTSAGFARNLSVYHGKSEQLPDLKLSRSTVINLTQYLRNKGRLNITNNDCTSINLAKYLYKRETNLIFTVRKNRKRLGNKTMEQNLIKSKYSQQQYLTFRKWGGGIRAIYLCVIHATGTIWLKLEKTGKGIRIKKSRIVVKYMRKQGVDQINYQAIVHH